MHQLDDGFDGLLANELWGETATAAA